MIHWALDVAVKSGVLDLIVVSTVKDGESKVRDVVSNYGGDIEVFVRDHNHPEQIERRAYDYTASQYPGFKFCTGIFGTSWFVRPSWIRASDKALRSVRMGKAKFGSPVTHVSPFPSLFSDPVLSWRLEASEWHLKFDLEFRGCFFDIDTETDFTQTEKVMAALLETQYFDDENIHCEPAVWDNALKWNGL